MPKKDKLLNGEMGTREEWRQEAGCLADRLQYLLGEAYRFDGLGDVSVRFIVSVKPANTYRDAHKRMDLPVDVVYRLVEIAKWGWARATGAKPLPKAGSTERKFRLVLGENFQPVDFWDKEFLAFQREGDPRLVITHEVAAWIVSVAALGWKKATEPKSAFEEDYQSAQVPVSTEDWRAAKLEVRLIELREDMQRGLDRVQNDAQLTALLISETTDARWAKRAAAKIPNYFKPGGPWARRHGGASPFAFVEVDAITPYDGACSGGLR